METFIAHSHISRLLLAVLPHINTEVQPLVSAVICFADLSVCAPGVSLKRIRHIKTDDLFQCDKEVIFNCLRPVCNPNERRLLDMFQNIGNMKKFYEMYQMMSALMPEGATPFGGFSQVDAFSNTSAEDINDKACSGSCDNDALFDTLSSMLTDEQKSTFEMLKTMFNTGSQL